ncbi:helix-turn-helix transcriptional regulator [Actinophytocola sp.]|uniref:helix-turn-helix transcriptional regulator n=1 Tax=Actinophytocola sp. TaxID=1872138 RepID=UPI002D811063|nr:LuxR C-terminal-related transcriptional regulator [Actinophytocola sp.]HET9139338.1 LuxR C-terminal-related transcriptional regulator [Actinophytocola sp.]
MPGVPPGFVVRTALRELIGNATEGPLTVINAPAGYGKTAVLADTAGPDTAWVSLDHDDNDPERFWAAVLLALSECAAVPRASPLRRLTPAADDPAFLAELVDALDMLPTPVRLVLDNAHELTDETLLHGLATLIRHQLSGVRLVLVARGHLALPLARARLQGGLTDIRAEDLRFSVDDAARLLRAAGVELTADRVARLVTHTDGWPAALRWAALSLRHAENPDPFLAGFAGDDRTVADYLLDEVIGQLAEEKADLLRVISICDEVPASLAAALSGRPDAAAMLEELDRETSLVVQVGHEATYRMQALLRGYLRADLLRRQPEHSIVLHSLASRWFAAHQRIPEALEHAAQTGGEVTTHDLLHRHALTMVLAGQHRPFRTALAALDSDAVDTRLTLVSALQHFQIGDTAAATAELDRVRDAPDAEPGLLRLVEGQLALVTGNWPAGPPAGDPDDGAVWDRLAAGWRRLRDGDRDGAVAEFDEALRGARHDGLRYLVMQALAALGSARALDQDYSAMRAACAEAAAIAEKYGWQQAPWQAEAHLLLAFASLTQFEPDACRQHSALARSAATRPEIRAVAQFLDGAAQFDIGHRQTGLRLMRQARRQLSDRALSDGLVAAVATIEYQAEALVGLETEARETLAWARERLDGCAELTLMAAWNQADPAVLDAIQPVLLATTPIHAQLLRTAAALRSNQRTTARRALAAALALAEPHMLIRPFAATDTSVWRLLVEQAGGFGTAGSFADHVRAVLAPVQATPIHGSLTSQQQTVLLRLSSARSLTEIAAELSVSVNTVKTHVRAIYVKLGVNNRRDAVVAAREHGLT